jgi:hypothetical protein
MLRNRPRWLAAVSLAALLVALIVPIRMDRRYARNYLLLSQDAQSTVEWKMAHWLNQHWTGERVLMWGPSAFWLTVFSDIPELWGTAHGTTDYTIRVAEFAIFNSYPAEPRNAEASVLWFKAFGVHALGISGLLSTPVRKFEGVLEPLWRYDNDAVIYRVDSRVDSRVESGRGAGGSASLARVIPRGALVSRTPIHGLDVDPLRPYVAALDDARMPRADFRWTSLHSAEISGNLEPGQVLSVQEAWHQGWHATANGKPAPILRDAIGLMYIDPAVSGPCRIQMIYDGGLELRAAWTLSILTALFLAITSIYSVLPAKNSGFLRWPRPH